MSQMSLRPEFSEKNAWLKQIDIMLLVDIPLWTSALMQFHCKGQDEGIMHYLLVDPSHGICHICPGDYTCVMKPVQRYKEKLILKKKSKAE